MPLEQFKTLRHKYLMLEQKYGSLGPFLLSVIMLQLIVYGGVAGYMLIDDWTFSDSLYQVAITLSTVGFQEVRPMSDGARTFTIFFIIIGVGNFMFMVAAMGQFLVESNLHKVLGRRRLQKSISQLEGHVVVCGFGRIGEVVVEEIRAAGMPVVVAESKDELCAELASHNILYVQGDATSDEVLRAAGLDKAAFLVAGLSEDSANVYVVLTARQFNPNLYVVARANSAQAIPRLERAGASRVVMPHMIGGMRMAQSVIRPSMTSFMELASSGEADLSLEEFRVSPSSILVGKNLIESEIRSRFNAIIVMVRHANGEAKFNPPGDYVIQIYDTLLVVGSHDQLGEFSEYLRTSSEEAVE